MHTDKHQYRHKCKHTHTQAAYLIPLVHPTSISTSRTIGKENNANLFIKSTFFKAACGIRLAMAVNSLFQITGAVPKKVSTLSMPVNNEEKERKR